MSDSPAEYQLANFETIIKAVHLLSDPSADPLLALARIHSLTSAAEVDGIIARSYKRGVSQQETPTDDA
jgi:hypothetical protein